MTDMPSGEISSEPSGHAVPGASTNLTRLVVFRRDSVPESDNVDPNHQNIQDLELGADLNYQNTQDMIVNTENWPSAQQYESDDALWELLWADDMIREPVFSASNDLALGAALNNQNTQDKIVNALRLLTFREKHVLVQFWSPLDLGEHLLLSTIDQPFGLSVLDAGLFSYRRDSARRPFIVEEENEEEDPSPATRVFRRRLPEWTSDINNYTPNQFPLQECATRFKLRGYLALPVFDLNTQLRVGVLELVTSSEYMNCAYEVQQIHMALKAQNLTSPPGFDSPSLYVVPNEHRKKDYDKIYSILKAMCDIHSLPVALTWAVSQHSSFVPHEKVIKQSCSSFDSRCIGKVCMSRAGLPFHVQDDGMWPYLKACGEQHLDRSRGFVGKALLSRGLCFCGDVTKLSEEEYPLVHNAPMYDLTSCFAIFLHSVEANDDYVLEFFLPPDIKDDIQLLNLVQTLKQNVEIASGFQLGDSSCIQAVEPLMVASKSLGIASITTTNNNQILTMLKKNITDAEEKHNRVKPGRKRKRDSLKMKAVEKHVGKPIEEAAKSLGVSRSTLKRFCREHDMPSWPLPKHSKKTVQSTDLKPPPEAQQNMQLHLSSGFGKLAFVVFLVVRVKRWSCSIRRHGFSGKWWSCGRHSYLPSKSDLIYQAALHNGAHPAVIESMAKPKYTLNNIIPYSRVAESSLIVQFTAKQTVADNTDIKMVTVKATYEEGTIRFQFPTSSGLLELEHEVARRIDLKGRKLRLRYKDEENELITLGCDDDLLYLLGFTVKNSTIKLIAEGR